MEAGEARIQRVKRSGIAPIAAETERALAEVRAVVAMGSEGQVWRVSWEGDAGEFSREWQ